MTYGRHSRGTHVGTFTYYIEHCGRELELTVSYSYYIGTTPAMGDDPTEVTITEVLDGSSRDITDKIYTRFGQNLWDLLEEEVIEAHHDS